MKKKVTIRGTRCRDRTNSARPDPGTCGNGAAAAIEERAARGSLPLAATNRARANRREKARGLGLSLCSPRAENEAIPDRERESMAEGTGEAGLGFRFPVVTCRRAAGLARSAVSTADSATWARRRVTQAQPGAPSSRSVCLRLESEARAVGSGLGMERMDGTGRRQVLTCVRAAIDLTDLAFFPIGLTPAACASQWMCGLDYSRKRRLFPLSG